MFVREIDLKKIILKLKRQKKDSCKMNFPLNHKLRYIYNVWSPTMAKVGIFFKFNKVQHNFTSF